MRFIMIALCTLGTLSCTQERHDQTPTPAEADRADAVPAPQSRAQEAAPQAPTKRIVGALEAYRPVKSFCDQLPPVEGAWREHPNATLTLVPQREQTVYRILGRTNLPDNIVVFAGIYGFSGWSDAHLIVEEGCFVSPEFHIGPGMYVLEVGISDLQGLDPSVAEEIGEYGWKLTENIVRVGGEKEFRVEKLVGLGADPEASYKSHLKLWEKFTKDVQELLVVGARMSKLRKRYGQGDWEALGKCSEGIERRNDDVRVMIDEYAQHEALFNKAVLGGIRTWLWDCVTCSPRDGDKGCREAKKELQRGAWKQDDVVAEFRARHKTK